jgi:hypothetical protein
VKRLLALLAALALLAGCSAIRVAYDNADAYARWRASDFFELAGEDAGMLEERIDAFHAWHRARALPQYARLADEAARRLADGLSQEDLLWGYDSVLAQARESLRAAGQELAPLLDKVGPEQAANLERGFDKDNRKLARENLRGSESERRHRRYKRNVERLEDWVGTLTQAQRERVKQYSDRAPLNEEMRERDRKRIQADILRIVRAREARKRLPERAARWDEGRDPAYVEANERWRKEYFAMLLDIDRSLSAEQRARTIERLRGFAEDFRVLAARQAGTAPRAESQ